jgi:hypothetical protein
MIRPFDIRDVNMIQRLRPLARTLAYEMVAVDGIHLLREAMTTYLTVRRDNSLLLVERDKTPGSESFGLMYILPEPNSDSSESGQRRAALVLMAPNPESDELVESWMYLAQEFALQAANQGVNHIIAEPAEYGGEAEALQAAGFVPLIHQDVLKLATVAEHKPMPNLPLIRMLHLKTAPKLTVQAEITSDLLRAAQGNGHSWVLVHGNELVAHATLREGRRGYGLQVLFRPKAEDEALPMLQYVLSQVKPGKPGPVYCTIRAYQSWLLPILDELGFAHITSTVLMTRHTAARVHTPVWSDATNQVAANAVSKKPSTSINRIESRIENQIESQTSRSKTRKVLFKKNRPNT